MRVGLGVVFPVPVGGEALEVKFYGKKQETKKPADEADGQETVYGAV